MYDLNDLWMVTLREKNGEVDHTEHLLFRAKSLEGCTKAVDRYLRTYFGDGEGDTVRDETKMLPAIFIICLALRYALKQPSSASNPATAI
jgi:hypothetical protein